MDVWYNFWKISRQQTVTLTSETCESTLSKWYTFSSDWLLLFSYTGAHQSGSFPERYILMHCFLIQSPSSSLKLYVKNWKVNNHSSLPSEEILQRKWNERSKRRRLIHALSYVRGHLHKPFSTSTRKTAACLLLSSIHMNGFCVHEYFKDSVCTMMQWQI